EMLAAPIDTITIGAKNYTVSQNGQIATLTVYVKEKELTGIAISKMPIPTEFIEGTTFSVNGGKLELTYDNGTTEAVDITSAMVAGPDMTKVGTAKATVTYGTFATTYDVTIVAKSVASIAMKITSKTDYIEGQNLDVTGGKIMVTYDNGTMEEMDITEAMCSGFDSSNSFDKQTITVTLDKAKTTYDINIAEKKLTGITVEKIPRNVYFINDELDVTDGVVMRNYDNDTSDTLAMTDKAVSFDGFSTDAAGTGTVIVKYEGKQTSYGYTISTRDRVDVLTKKIDAIKIDSLTITDKDMVLSLKVDYEALEDIEKAAMPSGTLTHLNDMIEKMNQLIDEENKKQ
ncbi:bacterial Ig-like domain-containing protein, partial [Eubacterium aggregans]|uniref:bacterial Ig-like domain-containing protein n=1 Tax=Eubacterium aggregans TaxID=81409 RepID=UPI003F3DD273